MLLYKTTKLESYAECFRISIVRRTFAKNYRFCFQYFGLAIEFKFKRLGQFFKNCEQ